MGHKFVARGALVSRRTLLRASTVGLAVAMGVPALTTSSLAETTLERIKREGKIKVGFFNGVPEAFVNESGKLTGESPEVLRATLKQIGNIEIELSNVDDFGALIPGLLASRFDIIASGLYIRPARCEQIAFSRPTAKYSEAIIVKKGNPLNLHSYEDIANNKNAIIAVNSGSMQATLAEAAGIPSERILQMPSTTALTAIGQGQVNALGLQSISAAATVKAAEGAGLEVAKPFKDPVLNGQPVLSYAGFGLRKDDVDLLQALNDALGKFLNSPEHLAVVEKFGFSEDELPRDKTAEEICSNK